MDRDLNASINILKRATAGQAGSNARGVGQQTDTEERSPGDSAPGVFTL
jgi:transposase